MNYEQMMRDSEVAAEAFFNAKATEPSVDAAGGETNV